MNLASPSSPSRRTSRCTPIAALVRSRRGGDESNGVVARVAHPVTRLLRASCVMALCMLGCDMVKREAVCADHASTADAVRRAFDAANEDGAPPEAGEQAAAAVRASAKTLDPAAGVPAVDDYKRALLKLADYHERRARGDAESEAENINFAYLTDFREKTVAFHEWCRG